MNLILLRTSFESYGIFGALSDETGRPICLTLEHAYPTEDLFYVPKLTFGSHICVRGNHQLEPTALNPHPKPFETFEIRGVPGHSNILFHVGNTNSDSSGCVLLGMSRAGIALLQSRMAFEAFLKVQEGVSQFNLTVK